MITNSDRHFRTCRKTDIHAAGRHSVRIRSCVPGFTLTELLVVIAIVVVLAVLTVQGVRRGIAGAKASVAMKNLQQIALGNLSYSTENGGRIVGLGNGIDWKGENTRGMGIMGRLYPYVSGSDKLPEWADLHSTYAPLRDANVPAALSSPPTPGTYQKTWASNHVFAEYPGPNTEGRLVAAKRMQQFDSADRVIYVISGWNLVNPQMGEDKSQVPLPAAPRNGIYYSYRSKAPAAFLDGHGELLSFPIKPQLFDPKYGTNP
jgi:prepilin-type N-terminal cleavage/methylation domain-containing protein